MTFFRTDYKKPNFDLVHTYLTFTLNAQNTLVEAELNFENAQKGQDIFLDGEELELQSISVKEYQCVEHGLICKAPDEKFTLKTTVFIHPDKNTALM